MDPTWFYMDGDTRRGPLTSADLLSALLEAPEPRLVRVWREGLPEWERAGSVPEFAAKLPPRLHAPARSTPVRADADEVRSVARLYRRLVLLAGAQLAIPFIIGLFDSENPSTITDVLILGGFVATIAIGLTMILTARRLMRLLTSGPALLWELGMFVRVFSLVVLWRISAHAQAWCKDRGIAVGFFGPSKASVERLSP